MNREQANRITDALVDLIGVSVGHLRADTLDPGRDRGCVVDALLSAFPDEAGAREAPTVHEDCGPDAPGSYFVYRSRALPRGNVLVRVVGDKFVANGGGTETWWGPTMPCDWTGTMWTRLSSASHRSADEAEPVAPDAPPEWAVNVVGDLLRKGFSMMDFARLLDSTRRRALEEARLECAKVAGVVQDDTTSKVYKSMHAIHALIDKAPS